MDFTSYKRPTVSGALYCDINPYFAAIHLTYSSCVEEINIPTRMSQNVSRLLHKFYFS